MSDPQFSRQSETAEQMAYEQQFHDQQPDPSTAPPSEEADDKMGMSSSSADQSEEKGKKKGLFRRLKDQIKTSFPEAVTDIKIMTSITALEGRVTREMNDHRLFPEVANVAHVRRGLELPPEELAFLQKRQLHVRDHFARYLGLNPQDVHPDDVPTVSFGGSGGGFRAMIGCLGYVDEMQRAGLWDCLTYVAGVSGSCWSLAAFYTFGHASMTTVIDHCKRRFSPYHPLSGDAIRTMLTVPGGAHSTLGPLIQKAKSGLQTVAMDLYSVFTTGWIFLQDDPAEHPGGHASKEVAGYQRSWYRWSSARQYLDSGAEPLPIMTAIRHERPWRDWHDKEHPFKDPDHATGDHETADDAWFQWFEMTPYEIGCDEIEAWVPTWGFGRPFVEGHSTMQLPEQSLALLLGLCTSAPAGPLTSYIATISRNLPTGFLGNSINSLAHRITRLWGKRGTDEFQNHHPLHACNEHNFLYHYTPLESQGAARPPGLENSPRIHLIDSGMDNNCPTYVLMHPHRRADVILAMDASSDVQKETFSARVEQIGRRRGFAFTKRETANGEGQHAQDDATAAIPAIAEPSAAQPPPTINEKTEEASSENANKDQSKTDEAPAEDANDPTRFRGRYAQIYDGVPCERPETVIDSYGKTVRNPPATVYPGRACTMVYLPLLPNPAAVKDFDPSTAAFSGSYNLVWTPAQVEMLVEVCRANYRDGEETVKLALREAWERRKAWREAGESDQRGDLGNRQDEMAPPEAVQQ